jgi:hypothetical protein
MRRNCDRPGCPRAGSGCSSWRSIRCPDHGVHRFPAAKRSCDCRRRYSRRWCKRHRHIRRGCWAEASAAGPASRPAGAPASESAWTLRASPRSCRRCDPVRPLPGLPALVCHRPSPPAPAARPVRTRIPRAGSRQIHRPTLASRACLSPPAARVRVAVQSSHPRRCTCSARRTRPARPPGPQHLARAARGLAANAIQDHVQRAHRALDSGRAPARDRARVSWMSRHHRVEIPGCETRAPRRVPAKARCRYRWPSVFQTG